MFQVRVYEESLLVMDAESEFTLESDAVDTVI